MQMLPYNHRSYITKLALIFSVMLLSFPAATTAETSRTSSIEGTRAQTVKPSKERRVPAISEHLYRQLQKAQKFLDENETDKASLLLENALASRRLNNYERAVIWQMKSSIAYNNNDVPATIAAYETILSFRDSIPVQQEIASLYSLAQLYFAEEDFQAARKTTEKWQAMPKPEPSAAEYQFQAQLYYTLNHYATALTHIDALLTKAALNDALKIQESWYQLKLSSHWEMGDLTEVKNSLEYMVQRWPSTRYWTQLAATHRELGNIETTYSVTEAAYRQGWLNDDEAQLLQVARIRMARETPIRCAWVLEQAFVNARVAKTPENMRMLGQCYLQAGEYEKALSPMATAASLDPDSAALRRLGQLYLQLDKLELAGSAFQQAAQLLDPFETKQKQKIFTLLMLQAQVQIELEQFAKAQDILGEAKATAAKKAQFTALKRWQRYLNAEEARHRLLTG